jgi:hypothetical protein
MLEEYYTQKGYNVLYLLSDNSDKNIFHIEAQDSFFYNDLSRFQNRHIDNKGFWEFSNIYFQDECVITGDMFQSPSDSSAMRFLVKHHKECSKNLIAFMNTVKEHLTELKTEKTLIVKKNLIAILKSDISIEEKFFALYYLISYAYFTFFVEEIRVMEDNVFMEKITQYYNKENCDVEVVIHSQREQFQTYLIRPRNKCYYYNKLEAGGELRELKEILFPDEDVVIRRIQRLDNNGHGIRLLVEKDAINKMMREEFF